jgi:LDH2 family malate/lactate/ureidoglycolate dehydrogenase
MVCSFAACHDPLVPQTADGLLTARDGHSSEDDVVIIEASRLREVVTSVLEREGATRNNAAAQAEVLVEGDLRGHHSHGVRRLSVLVGRLRNGLVRSGDEPVHRWRTDSVPDVDGLSGFGPMVARSAIGAIIERARTAGVALATVRNANHVGMLAPYVERIAAAGQIGIALTTSEALVHPWGGAHPMVGTNPIGIGIPTAGPPLVLDMSTAAVSMGKLLDHAAQARPIPLGWAVDESGAPTTDAKAATRGAVSPFGGPKGYGLGLALEVLVATLTGSVLARGSAARSTSRTSAPRAMSSSPSRWRDWGSRTCSRRSASTSTRSVRAAATRRPGWTCPATARAPGRTDCAAASRCPPTSGRSCSPCRR